MLRTLTLGELLVPSLLVLSACALPTEVDDETLPWDAEGESVDVDDEKADAAGEIRVRARAMTVWVRPALEAREDGTFVIRGRASRNLAEVRSFVPDDRLGTARILSARTFEIALDAHETSTLSFGLPLFVSLAPLAAPEQPVSLAITGRARLAQMSGSRAIRPSSTLRPVYVGREVLYRATVVAPEGTRVTIGGMETVRTRSGHEADLSFGTVSDWARSAEPIEILAGSERKTAIAQLVLARVRITDRDAYQAWPPMECAGETLSCLHALGGADGDTSACGDAYPVTRCLGALAEEASLGERFATDLRAHLEGWYAMHGADVVAAGGNDLVAAQAAVDPALATEVLSVEDDPFGHDLATTRVVRHPDVAFPGSDRAWFGAYDRSTWELIGVYDFE